MDYTHLESLFESLLNDTQSELSIEERNEVRSFLDVGEYGLAFETMVSIYIEEGKFPSLQAVALIESLANSMSMDTAPFHRHMQNWPSASSGTSRGSS